MTKFFPDELGKNYQVNMAKHQARFAQSSNIKGQALSSVIAKLIDRDYFKGEIKWVK